MNSLCPTLMTIVLLLASALASQGSPRTSHVFIVSIDGGKPAVIAESEMPVLKRLVGQGACTWAANTISPSLTLPSHTSMLTGVGPDKHHILWNTWEPQNGVVAVPTIFAEAKRGGGSTAMFVGKEKFRHLLQPGTVDKFEFDQAHQAASGTVASTMVAKNAARYILENKPNLCFIHFTDPDDTGHEYGWGSPQQIKAFSQVDEALGEILNAIEAAGIRNETVLLITADHGGHGRTHGQKSPEDMLIPWIAWGKSVRRDFSITALVTTYDTAATALWLLGLPVPESFDGKPVVSAFAWPGAQVGSEARGYRTTTAQMN